MRYVLSENEKARLKKARPVGTIKICAHERKQFQRADQDVKDRTIEEFASRYLGQLETRGLTSTDRRHMRRLINIMEDVLS